MGRPESHSSDSQAGGAWSLQESRQLKVKGGKCISGLSPALTLTSAPRPQALPHADLSATKRTSLLASTHPLRSIRVVSLLPSPGHPLPLFKPSIPGNCPGY